MSFRSNAGWFSYFKSLLGESNLFNDRGDSRSGDSGVDYVGYLYTTGPYTGDGLPFVAINAPVTKVAAGKRFCPTLLLLTVVERKSFYLCSRARRINSGVYR